MRDTIIKARDIETKVSYLIHGEWIYRRKNSYA